ncbi:MAG: Gfo/Idh/MocA family oxidoreductase [Planctomycetota bacterium]|nr:Gfo/Idh/MocA family oxidoreductase [Planctomycetota bacterium]
MPPASSLSMAPPATLRVGVVGCGSFARFATQQYRTLPGLAVTAVADLDAAAAGRAAAELGVGQRQVDAMLTAGDIDLVYIATPPAAHFRQAKTALEAGKHVLVEKPPATTVAEAEELARLAAQGDLVCTANLVERYAPLADLVKQVIHSRLLGELIHGLFINDASDEGLGRNHWFWNRDVSGGIFIEHGVHFFDLVADWLGAATVVSAARSVRPHAENTAHQPVEEQVCCTCRYATEIPQTGVLVHFEHGFHQPSRLDRQELRLVFERGELRLFDWVFTHGILRALVDGATLDRLADILPGSVVRQVDRFDAAARRMRGRFKSFEASSLVEITFSSGLSKMETYARAVRDLAADQVAWIHDRFHCRRVTAANGVAAVATAHAADTLARTTG